jgi:hypothetical protein
MVEGAGEELEMSIEYLDLISIKESYFKVSRSGCFSIFLEGGSEVFPLGKKSFGFCPS